MLGVVYVLKGAAEVGCDTKAAPDRSEEGSLTMATNHKTPPPLAKRIDVAALTKRLEEHADGIENVAARAMADDMRLGAQVINRLVEEIRAAATTTNGAIAQLVDLVGWQ